MDTNQKRFHPIGPFDIQFEDMPGGKRITKEHVINFWKKATTEKISVGTGKGIYIFGMKVTTGVIPCYVGKTKNSFEKECFTDRNLNIYNGEIIRYKRKYKPFMFFLSYHPTKKQKISDKVIRELERYVTNLAAETNDELVNIRGIKDDERFVIEDLGGGRGKGAPTKEGIFFKKMMKY